MIFIQFFHSFLKCFFHPFFCFIHNLWVSLVFRNSIGCNRGLHFSRIRLLHILKIHLHSLLFVASRVFFTPNLFPIIYQYIHSFKRIWFSSDCIESVRIILTFKSVSHSGHTLIRSSFKWVEITNKNYDAPCLWNILNSFTEIYKKSSKIIKCSFQFVFIPEFLNLNICSNIAS